MKDKHQSKNYRLSNLYKLKKLIKKDEKVKSNSDKVRAQITGKLVKFCCVQAGLQNGMHLCKV